MARCQISKRASNPPKEGLANNELSNSDGLAYCQLKAKINPRITSKTENRPPIRIGLKFMISRPRHTSIATILRPKAMRPPRDCEMNNMSAMSMNASAKKTCRRRMPTPNKIWAKANGAMMTNVPANTLAFMVRLTIGTNQSYNASGRNGNLPPRWLTINGAAKAKAQPNYTRASPICSMRCKVLAQLVTA